MNIIPGLSQVKSFVQLVSGDAKGAAATQKDFFTRCPGVSQAVSVGILMGGDIKGACDVQKKCISTVGSLIDGVPGVGHVKGVIHYLLDDREGGDRAMKSASRTVGVMGGGAAGFVLGGPVGAIAGGMGGGIYMDTLTTVCDSLVHGEDRPNGTIALVSNLIDQKSESASGDVCDLTFGLIMDGLTGQSTGELTQKIIDRTTNQRVYRIMKKDDAIKSIENQQLYSSNPNGETWTSESVYRHQRNYYEKKVQTDPLNDYSCVQVKIQKTDYNQIKQDSIPQHSSSATNKALQKNGQAPKNLFNREKLANHPHGKVNLGIKGEDNFNAFNKKIVETKIINLKSMQYDNTVTKFVGTYGKPTTTSCVRQGLRQNQEDEDDDEDEDEDEDEDSI